MCATHSLHKENPMLKFLLALSMGVFCVSPLQAGDITPVTKSCEPGAKQAQCERWVQDIKKAGRAMRFILTQTLRREPGPGQITS
ncbi:hypothetical protein ACCT19_14745, partial [Rhizobium ruizarguesonis]